jgi:hypothetical protein
VIVLIEVYSILEAHCTLDHEVGAVPPDASVHNNPVDLYNLGVGVIVCEALTLLAFEKEPPSAALFNVNNRVM